jgi:hypothetical protein
MARVPVRHRLRQARLAVAFRSRTPIKGGGAGAITSSRALAASAGGSRRSSRCGPHSGRARPPVPDALAPERVSPEAVCGHQRAAKPGRVHIGGRSRRQDGAALRDVMIRVAIRGRAWAGCTGSGAPGLIGGAIVSVLRNAPTAAAIGWITPPCRKSTSCSSQGIPLEVVDVRSVVRGPGRQRHVLLEQMQLPLAPLDGVQHRCPAGTGPCPVRTPGRRRVGIRAVSTRVVNRSTR